MSDAVCITKDNILGFIEDLESQREIDRLHGDEQGAYDCELMISDAKQFFLPLPDTKLSQLFDIPLDDTYKPIESDDFDAKDANENKWKYAVARQRGLKRAVNELRYSALCYLYRRLRDQTPRITAEIEERSAITRSPFVSHEIHRAEMLEDIKDQTQTLKVKSFALNIRQFFLKLDNHHAELFVRELTADPGGRWSKLFALKGAIGSKPLPRLDPTREASKAYLKALRSGKTMGDATAIALRRKSEVVNLKRITAEVKSTLPKPTRGRQTRLLPGKKA
jgi:hypothetical protein